MKSTGKTSNKRARLIDTTKALLWEIGYESMSPKKILQQSGAGQGSLYHHFTGKEALASVALHEIDAEMCEAFDQAFADNDAPLESLLTYLRHERDGLKGCRLGRLANETSIAGEALSTPLVHYFSHLQTVIAQTLTEAVQRGDIDKTISPEDTAAALVAVVQGGYVLSRIHNDKTQIHRATDGAAAMLMALKTH